jgi:ribosomal protein S7
MQDMRVHLEKLRTDAAECALIRDLATDRQKRELFTRLAEHLSALASEVEAAIAAKLDDERRA